MHIHELYMYIHAFAIKHFLCIGIFSYYLQWGAEVHMQRCTQGSCFSLSFHISFFHLRARPFDRRTVFSKRLVNANLCVFTSAAALRLRSALMN